MGDSLPLVLACRPSGVDWASTLISGAVLLGVSWLLVAFIRWVLGEEPETMLRSCVERNICFECEYDLRGLDGLVCPECGTKVPKELVRCLETGEDLDAIPGILAVRRRSSA